MTEQANNSAAAATETVTTAQASGAGESQQTQASDTTVQQAPAQTTEQTQQQNQQGQQGTTGEELILGKFKNAEDLAASYTALEKKFHEAQRQRKAPSEVANTLFGQQEGAQTQGQAQNVQQAQQLVQGAQQAQAQGGQAGEDAFWQQNGFTAQQGTFLARLVDHLANQRVDARVQQFEQRLGPLNSVLSSLTQQNAVRELQHTFSDFDDYEEDIANLMKSDEEIRGLAQRNPAKWLRSAYLQLKAQKGDTKAKEATVAAKVSATAAEQTRQQNKAAAAVEQPGSRQAPSGDKPKSLNELLS